MEEEHEPEGEDDSMPGFYEEEELESENLEHDVDHTVEGADDPLSKMYSKPRSSISDQRRLAANSKDTSEASGSSLAGQERVVTMAEHHTCPICSKQLETDNQGLNAHIDFCLSKGAILEAHAEANSPKKPGRKPESTSKKRKR